MPSIRELRVTCARACNLSRATGEKASSEVEADTACCCIPLRTAVFLAACESLCAALLLILLPSARLGGYDMKGRVLLGIILILGGLWGIFGIIGTAYLNGKYVGYYMYFQMAHVAAFMFVTWRDIPLLYDCEMWKTHLDEAIGEYGWNPQLYGIAIRNECQVVRFTSITWSVLNLAYLLYLLNVIMRLVNELNDEPKFLLKVRKDHPSGAFYSKSLGTRTGMKEQQNQPRLGNMFAPMGPPMGPPIGVGPFGPPRGPMGPPMGSFMGMGPPMGPMNRPMGPPMNAPMGSFMGPPTVTPPMGTMMPPPYGSMPPPQSLGSPIPPMMQPPQTSLLFYPPPT